MSLSLLLGILIALLLVEVLLVIAVFVNKHLTQERLREDKAAREYLYGRYFGTDNARRDFTVDRLARAYRAIRDQVVPAPEAEERAYRDFQDCGAIRRWLADLGSPFSLKRKTAARMLTYFPSTETRFALVNRLRIERSGHVKLYIVDALKNQLDQLTIVALIESMIGSKRFYQARAIAIIKNYLPGSKNRLPDIFNRDEPEIKELFVELAEGIHREDFGAALKAELAELEDHYVGECSLTYGKMTAPRRDRFYRRILAAVATGYGYDLSSPKYLQNPDPEIVRIAVHSLTQPADMNQVEKLLKLADGSIPASWLAETIQKIFDQIPERIPDLIGLLEAHPSREERLVLGIVIADKLDYFVLRLQRNDPGLIQVVVDTIIAAGRDANLIRFLNNNRDPATEATVLPALKAAALREERLFALLNEYLDSSLMKKMGFAKTKAPMPAKPVSRPEKAKIRWLRGILVFAFLLFPVLFVILRFNVLTTGSFRDILVSYVVMVNYVFIAYYVAVNLVYLILAAISFRGARKQRRLWQLKNNGMLFEKGMLASIAIIAPAYNESVTIVESVESLLNLRYPDFEVVVVNDGSGDDTLQKLIDHFALERRNVAISDAIPTRPIRGIYVNRNIPNLTVVDKMNGGKADALNVGINVAKKEYVCGIDADSLLEPDSLLKLMSTTIDHDEITLCLGGNIFPANGCTVDHGVITATAMPKSLLARFQTVEYLRAFSLGRIGWAELDALLIISGAFGLFERRILSEVGGYLTESAFHKDTVGEDMELVVRITRYAIERKLPFRVDYVHNAECFTEVPQDGKSLLKQRNRWQRGLIDILSYHRRMIGNPKYRQPGLIAMPYFVLFETIGPLLEVQAYAAIFAGLFLGILSVEILIALMIVTIVMGMILSILSLFVAERHTVHLGTKDTLRLIFVSILENFGWRQFWSLYRIRGFFSSLRDNFTWGEMARVGFNKGK